MKRDERKIALRCAVYTRVSTDTGLEQDFNSLDTSARPQKPRVRSVCAPWRFSTRSIVRRARAALKRCDSLLLRCAPPLRVTASARCGVLQPRQMMGLNRAEGSRLAHSPSKDGRPSGRPMRDPRSGFGLDAEHGSRRADSGNSVAKMNAG